MAEAWCSACGAEIHRPHGRKAIACPLCGAEIDLLPWLRIDAVERIKGAVDAEAELPADLRGELNALLARRSAALEEALPSIPPALASGAEDSVRPEEPVRHAPEAPAPPPRRVRKRRVGPGLWERLGPAFAENLGFALAGFLIVAGAVFFATTAWTIMTGPQRLFVVSGGLSLLGAVLLGAGRLLNRGGTLPEVERVLLFVSGLLASVAAVPAGDLLAHSPAPGAGAGFLALALAFCAGRGLARTVDGTLISFLPWALPLAAAGVLAAPFAGGLLPYRVAGASALLLAGLGVQARSVVPRSAAGLAGTLVPPALLAFALLAFALRTVYAEVQAGLAPVRALAALGIAVAALGAGLAAVEGAHRRGRGAGGAVAPLMAIACAVAGSAIALGEGVALALAAAIGAWAALRAGMVLPVPWLLAPGLALAAVAYFQAPAPVREAALRLRDQAAAALGYAGRPLPLGYYGLTFFPYVAACAIAGVALRKRGRMGASRVLLAWTLGCALGLCALSLGCGDLRPPAAVLALQGLLLLWMGARIRGRWTLLAGGLCVAGGLVSGLTYLHAERSVIVLCLSGLGLLGAGLGAWLSRRPRPGAALLRVAGLEIGALLSGPLCLLALAECLVQRAEPAWGWTAFLALALLLGWIASAFRSPLAALLAGVALAAAGARIGGLLLPATPGGAGVLGAALAAAIPFLWFRKIGRVPRPFRHPSSRKPDPARLFPDRMRAMESWTVWTVVAAQLVGLLSWVRAPGAEGWTWPFAAGLAAGAVILFLVARAAGKPEPAPIAFFQLLAAALAVCGALGLEPAGTAGALACGIACAVGWFPAWCPGLPAPARFGAEELRWTVPAAGLPFALWMLVLVAERFGEGRVPVGGAALAAACLLVAGAGRLALRAGAGIGAAAGLPAGLLLGPAAVGVLLELGAGWSWYPLGLLAAAVCSVAWAGSSALLAAPAGVHTLAGFAVAVVLAVEGRGTPGLLLASFLALAAAGRIAAWRVRYLGGLLLLAALLAALAAVLFPRYWHISSNYQPALWIAYAGAALLASRIPALGVCRAAARTLAWPVLGLAWAGALLFAGLLIWGGPGFRAEDRDLAWLRAAGAAFVPAVATVLIGGRDAWRRIATVMALGLASFIWAPVQLLLAGPGLREPDVELALLGLLLAGFLPRARESEAEEQGRLGWAWFTPFCLGLAGVLLTWGEWRHPSTPLAFGALAAAGLVVFLRDRGKGTGGCLAIAGLAAALALAAFLRPASGPLAESFLLLPAAVAGLAASGLRAAAGRFGGPEAAAWRRDGALEWARVAAFAAALAFALVAADVALGRKPARAAEVALAWLALGVPAGAMAARALRGGAPGSIHGAVAGLVLAGVFCFERTTILDPLAGLGLHALAVLGGTLILCSSLARGRVGRLLATDGLLLAVPAVLVHAPGALGLAACDGSSWSALTLAALVAAAAAHGMRRAWLWWVALGLANLVLYSIWRNYGLVDPTFYGAPPGLTLLGGAYALGRRAGPAARLGLLAPGFGLLYGPAALQVFRAGRPVHALALFGLGLATAALGLWFRRTALLTLGLAVVVLDVLVYLASHGFETDFLGAALLLGGGLSVLAAAALAARRRREAARTAGKDAGGPAVYR